MCMQFLEEVESGTVERLKKQAELLVRTYQREFALDPDSGATKSSRSNVIALRHTLKQMYGEAVEVGSHQCSFGKHTIANS
jgi:hypothetical protein